MTHCQRGGDSVAQLTPASKQSQHSPTAGRKGITSLPPSRGGGKRADSHIGLSRLGPAKKKIPHDWVLVKEGDHVFAFREQTPEAMRYNVEWMEQFEERPV